MQKWEWNISDGYDIGRWELAVADDIYIREVSISAQIYNTYQYMYRATK
jgi:hypothetical protein